MVQHDLLPLSCSRLPFTFLLAEEKKEKFLRLNKLCISERFALWIGKHPLKLFAVFKSSSKKKYI
jgi:hypothetical protein